MSIYIIISKNPYLLRLTGGTCYNAYINFDNEISASLAIVALDKFYFEGTKLEASFGTTKQCFNFLKKKECFRKHCKFVHYEANENNSFCKTKNQSNKQIFSVLKYYAYDLIYHNKDLIKSSSQKIEYKTTVLPRIQKVLKISSNYKNRNLNTFNNYFSTIKLIEAFQKFRDYQNSLKNLKKIVKTKNIHDDRLNNFRINQNEGLHQYYLINKKNSSKNEFHKKCRCSICIYDRNFKTFN